MATFLENVDRAAALLRERARVSVRALRRELSLDDDELEDLIEELVDVQGVAARDGNVLSAVAGDSSPVVEEIAERRQLTVMFCDLVGSTALADRIDPEALREILDEYRQVCVRASERVGGHVAQYLGDGVMVYFGYPHAQEDAAVRAIRAGLEIQRTLDVRTGDDPIEARIGIHTGLVVIDPTASGDAALALGSTTNIAARIEGAAEAGTVVVSDATLQLCHGGFATRAMGPVSLKGIQEPVVLHQVLSLASVRSGLEVTSDKPLVGRVDEARTMQARFQSVVQGQGQVVVVSGEAGIGKSRLVQALHDDIGSAHLWLDTQCSPFSSGSAFEPLINMLRAGFALEQVETPAAGQEAVVAGIAAMQGINVGEVVPYLLSLLGLPESETHPMLAMSPEEQRERTFAALLTLAVSMAELQPVVFFFEDLHWIDPSTLEYLDRLVDVVPSARILLICTYRDEFQPSWRHQATEISLARLSAEETLEMISGVAGAELPDAVLKQLQARSDGVPLFVQELTASVVQSDAFVQTETGYAPRENVREISVPSTLQDSLMARLDRLYATKVVAQQAATIGREFSYQLMTDVSDFDPQALAAGLAELVNAGVLYQRGAPPDATYTFCHALVQDTAYESQLFATRRALHARIVETLQKKYPKRVEREPEVMARHCSAAGMEREAVTHYQSAALLAVARMANREAADHFQSALDALLTLEENTDRHQWEAGILLAQTNSLAALYGYKDDRVSANLERAETLVDALGVGPQQLPTLLGLLQFDIARGNNAKPPDRARAVIEISEPIGAHYFAAIGYLILAGSSVVSGSAEEACQSAAKSCQLCDEGQFPGPATAVDLDIPSTAYNTYATLNAICGRFEQARAAHEVSYERVLECGNDATFATNMGSVGHIGYLLGDPELGRRFTEEALARCEGRGFHSAEQMALLGRGWSRAMQGEIEAGIRDVDRSLEIAKTAGSLAGLGLQYVMTAQVYRMAGNKVRAVELLDEVEPILVESGETGYAGHIALTRAEVEYGLADTPDWMQIDRWLDQTIEEGQRDGRLLDEVLAETLRVEIIASNRVAVASEEKEACRKRLEEIVGRFTEGLNEAPLLRAQAAIDALRV